MPKGDCALRWRRTCLLTWKTWNRKRGRALRAPSRNAQTRSVSEGDYISAERKFLALEQRASPPRDALFVGRRALQTFERRLKSGTVSVVSRVAHNGKEL